MKLNLPFNQGEINLQLPYYFKIEDTDESQESEGDAFGCITDCKVIILHRTVDRVEINNRLYLAPDLPRMPIFFGFEEIHTPITAKKWESEVSAAIKLLKTDHKHG